MVLPYQASQLHYLIMTATARKVCRRIYYKHNATTLAHTHTSVWIKKAHSIPNGWSKNKRRKGAKHQRGFCSFCLSLVVLKSNKVDEPPEEKAGAPNNGRFPPKQVGK